MTILAATVALLAGKEELDISVYNPGEKAVFAISSKIVSGPSEVLLVDAQFFKANAEAPIERIKATGKTLKTASISHSDPDGRVTIYAAFRKRRSSPTRDETWPAPLCLEVLSGSVATLRLCAGAQPKP
ncbi:hypothetical protein [Pseudochelatococcus sp. G4_1912]|uniref:hypothetical protein n=1 Tax=Pseudochelatococcus sp. G4_1912 TaxID=3114288 RepID=UPI0039C64FA7